jgi:hypothetical protein
MLFVAAAFAGGLVAAAATHGGGSPDSHVLSMGRRVTSLLLNLYSMRMAAVFMISTATITLRTAVVPRWIAFLGYACALVLLFGIGLSPWVEPALPDMDSFCLSIDILRAGGRTR